MRNVPRLFSSLILTAFAATFPACGQADERKGAAPPGATSTGYKKVGKVVFIIDVKGKTQTQIPDYAYLWTGQGAPDTSEVWWVFTHKSAKITFKPKPGKTNPKDIPEITNCESLGKLRVCKWVIARNDPKVPKGTYGFTIDGTLDNDEKLDSLDPEVEIDR